MESLVFQELKACIDNNSIDASLFFYRTENKTEVDFVIYGPDSYAAIEVKRSSRLSSKELEGLREFKLDYPASQRYLFYPGEDARVTVEGIRIMHLAKSLLELKNILLNQASRY